MKRHSVMSLKYSVFLNLLLTSAFCLSFNALKSQEVNFGILGGTFLEQGFPAKNTIGISTEFKPFNKAALLIGIDAISADREGIIPVYVKFRIGHKLRVNPNLGCFIGGNGFGLRYGINVEYDLLRRFFAAINFDGYG